MKSTALSQLLLILISSVAIDAFFHVSLPKNRNAVSQLIAANTDSTVEDYNEMRNLVLSLSQVATDEDRRASLANIFEEALARPNGQPKEFTDLFAEALTNVGSEVQAEAKKKFAAKEAEVSNLEAANFTDSTEEKESEGERVKSTEEQQLWAVRFR